MALSAVTRSLRNVYANYAFPCFSRDLTQKNANYVSIAIERIKVNDGRLFCSSAGPDTSLPGDDPAAGPKPKRRKTVEIPQISLIDEKGKMKVTNMEAAEKIAKRMNLKLVQLEPAVEKRRAVFKLMSLIQFINEGGEEAPKSKKAMISKKTKIIHVASKIGDHDLDVKIQSAVKALAKDNFVQVIVEGGDQSSQSKIVKKFEIGVQEVATVQNKVAGSKSCRLNLKPIKREEAVDSSPLDEENCSKDETLQPSQLEHQVK